MKLLLLFDIHISKLILVIIAFRAAICVGNNINTSASNNKILHSYPLEHSRSSMSAASEVKFLGDFSTEISLEVAESPTYVTLFINVIVFYSASHMFEFQR